MANNKFLYNDNIKRLVQFRHELHACAEMSGDEKVTSQKIISQLKRLSPDSLYENVGGYGVIAVFNGLQKGPSVLFRADMDALGIEEKNNLSYRSKNQKVSHKCGHDGHCASLLGLAQIFSENRPQKGKAILLFQPAEETGEGASAVINSEVYQILNPDYCFAYHNLPGYPLNTIVCKKDSFTASVKSLIVKLDGKAAHAAEPELGINPSTAIADILSQFDTLSNNNIHNEKFTLITPVHINMGNLDYGTSASKAEMHFTIRAWTEGIISKLEEDLKILCKMAARHHNLSIDFEVCQAFASNTNNHDAVNAITTSANELQLNTELRKMPFKWGEDFGYFTQHCVGAMFGIGSGEECRALHNPDYDFPDSILSTAINMFYQISTKYL